MEKLNIPKQIHIGYQNREGTYTGRLAYVIYTDQKGKKRKTGSWSSWRDHKIDPDDYDNEPISGFVLNKGVGGARNSWGWNPRNEYIRVYDPRGFEFEISVANLLFILTNCTATKGKGLEGEFVYAWDKADLILLPVDCFEYKSSIEFTALQSKKVTKANMHEGWTYQDKNTNILIYLGRHKIRDLNNHHVNNLDALLAEPDTFRHVFYNPKTERWHFERGFTKLAAIVSEESHPDFANLYTNFVSSKYVCEPADLVLTPISIDDLGDRYRSSWFYIKVDGGYQLVFLNDRRPRHYSWCQDWRTRRHQEGLASDLGMTDDHFWPLRPDIIPEITRDNLHHGYGHHYDYELDHAVSRSYLEGKELFTPQLELKSKERVGIYYYVQRCTDQAVSCCN